MGTTLSSGSARSMAGRGLGMGLLPLLLATACTGTILGGDSNGSTNGGGNGVVDPITGLPTVPGDKTPPAPLPDSAPTTGAVASRAGASSRFVLLNNRQWENTMRDLLGLPSQPGLSKTFVKTSIRTSFDTHGGDLEIDVQQWQDYKKAAGTLATQVARDAARLNALMPSNAPTEPEARAKAFITGFGLRAYRRPLTDAEVNQYLAVYKTGATGAGAVDGLEMVLAVFLNSPHVLYRTELSNQVTNGRVVLSDYEVANRLSYGLINTMPDAELFAAAGAKQLRSRDQVLAQAKRLLESPLGQATVRDIHEQMIKEVDPGELVRDAKLHPLYKAGIGIDMKEENLAFVQEIVFGQGKSVAELLTASWTMLNSKLAPLYGVTLPAGAGDKFVKVDLDPKQRAGLYTQLGFLAETATDFNPRPIKRGVHLSDHLLCNKVPPPPPEANQTPIPNKAGSTNRQSFTAATETDSLCAGCHGTLINPLGWAFERYDGMGKYRQDENGLPIDSTGAYDFAEGRKSFDGAVELMKIIAEGKQAHDCYSKQIFEYVYGRSATEVDAPLVTELGRRSKLKVPIKNLMLDLVATEAFFTRLP